MRYQTPKMDVYLLEASDVLTASGIKDGGNNGADVVKSVNDLFFR